MNTDHFSIHIYIFKNFLSKSLSLSLSLSLELKPMKPRYNVTRVKVATHTGIMSTSLPKSLLIVNGDNSSSSKKRKRGGSMKKSRKQRRKEERLAKKRNRFEHQLERTAADQQKVIEVQPKTKQKKKKKKSVSFADIVQVREVERVVPQQDPEDREIEYLERKLGLRGGKKNRKSGWKKLEKEWKDDGFGDDFGDFIAGLDRLSDSLQKNLEEEEEEEDIKEEKVEESSSDDSSSSDDDRSSEDEEEEQDANNDTFPKGQEKDIFQSPEDQEIDYLERKLGLKGNKSGGKKAKKENLKRLAKEWKKDGFDDEFCDFIMNLDKKKEASQEESSSSSSSSSESEDEDDDNNNNNNTKDATYIPSQREIDIYGRKDKDSSSDLKSKPRAYVPPHLRVSQEASQDSQKIRQLQRRIQGQLNRVSESNIEPILIVIRGCFDSYPRMQVCAVLASKILKSCGDQVRDNLTLMRCYAAIVSSLHITAGAEIGAYVTLLLLSLSLSLPLTVTHPPHSYFLEDITRRYDETRRNAVSNENNTRSKFESMNLLLVLLFMYQNSVLDYTFIVEIASQLVDDLSSPVHLELLLLLLMHVGFALRKEEPGSLLDIIKRVHRQADRHRDDWIEKGHESRVQFMLDTMNDLSSNRQRAAQQQLQQGGKRLRTWVQRLKQKDQRAHPPLRVTWEDLMASGHRGRWWIVGSSWVGRQQKDEEKSTQLRKGNKKDDSAVGVARNASSKMLALASKHHMNTDTRKAIFCVLMSSADYLEAFERLLKLGLKGPQKREICRVLLYCCGVSKRYNPYFALVAKQQCQFDHRTKFTLQLCFWDAFKLFGNEINTSPKSTERKLMNYARLLSDMTKDFHLSLGTLKVIDVLSLTPDAIFFLRAYFFDLMETCDEKTLEAVFRRISASKDCEILLNSISVFFKTKMGSFKDEKLKQSMRVIKMALRDVAIVSNARKSAI